MMKTANKFEPRDVVTLKADPTNKRFLVDSILPNQALLLFPEETPWKFRHWGHITRKPSEVQTYHEAAPTTPHTMWATLDYERQTICGIYQTELAATLYHANTSKRLTGRYRITKVTVIPE